MNIKQAIERRPLCPGGPSVTRLACGGIPIGTAPYEVAEAVLHRALDLGINLIDTSWNYHDSEAHIGRALERRRDEFALITKLGKRTAEEARAELEHAMTLLRTDHLDACFLHSVSGIDSYEKVMSAGGALETLMRARDEGLVRHLGISIHRDLRVMRRAIESGAFEIMMLVCNVIDNENTMAEMLPLARQRNIGVLAMKALGGGTLIPSPEAGFSREECDRVVRDAIRCVLRNPLVTAAPVGFANPAEVDAAVEAATMPPITDVEIDALRAALVRMKTPFRYGQVCLRCGYCAPCSRGIPIPDVFRAADAYAAYSDDLKPLAEQMYAVLPVSPTACTECRECMPRCPAGIDIPRRLKLAVDAFTAKSPEMLKST